MKSRVSFSRSLPQHYIQSLISLSRRAEPPSAPQLRPHMKIPCRPPASKPLAPQLAIRYLAKPPSLEPPESQRKLHTLSGCTNSIAGMHYSPLCCTRYKYAPTLKGVLIPGKILLEFWDSMRAIRRKLSYSRSYLGDARSAIQTDEQGTACPPSNRVGE